jgi:hypothetical protein
MGERPLLYFALGILVTTSIGAISLRDDGIQFPDGSLQTSADTRRAFYLSDSSFWVGNNVHVACDDGFHFASLWEILDPTELRYVKDEELSEGFFAARNPDSGDGPPAGLEGWIRTGATPAGGSTTDDGEANCDAYTTNLSIRAGTTVQLNSCWDSSGYCTRDIAEVGWWKPLLAACHQGRRVWCVQD